MHRTRHVGCSVVPLLAMKYEADIVGVVEGSTVGCEVVVVVVVVVGEIVGKSEGALTATEAADGNEFAGVQLLYDLWPMTAAVHGYGATNPLPQEHDNGGYLLQHTL